MASHPLPDRPAILREAREQRDFIVDLTLRLCREITVSYDPEDYPHQGPDGMPAPGMESRVVRCLEPHLKEWNIPHQTHAKVEDRENLIARIGRGEEGYKKLLVLLHTDTVPAGAPEDWHFDPFAPFEQDGKLFGRGVLDNKGPLASCFAALQVLKNHEEAIPGEFIFAAVCDEEVGIGAGLAWLLKEGLIECTDALVPDIAGEMREINVAEKGRAVLRLSARGKQAHAMEPSKGVNAIHGLARWLCLLEDHTLSHENHALLGGPTMNVGLVRGGVAPNAVPGDSQATLDIRFVPGQSARGVQGEIEALARRIDMPGCSFRTEIASGTEPIAVSPEAPIVRKILEHAPEAKIVGSGGSTFAHDLVLHGIEAVGWAPGNEETYHQPNEEIEVEQLLDFAGRLANLALDLCAMKA